MKSLLTAIESEHRLRYVLGGMSTKSEPEVFDSSAHIPHVGCAMVGDHNREPFYLVIDSAIEAEARTVQQRNGETRFFFDQQLNPRSVVLKPGGVYQQTFIIAGQIGTGTSAKESEDLLKVFAKELRRQFSKVKSYYVGNEALRLLDGGLRLTTNVQAPVEYDLRKD
jgi:hypothetical protein